MRIGAKDTHGYLINICGDKIKRNRVTMELTQEQLAAKLQVEGVMLSRVQISKIETGDRYITDVELTAFFRILGKDLLIDYINELNLRFYNSDIQRLTRKDLGRATFVAEDDD